MPQANSKATQLEERIIACKLEGLTNAETAKRCGLGKRTLQRRIAQPDFKSKYEEAKTAALEDVINAVRFCGMTGLTALRDIAGDTTAASTARVMAGKGILEILLRATEIQVLVARLDKLEAAMKDGDR